jgi:uncharacterized membrane protein YcaP (DUF421 family)
MDWMEMLFHGWSGLVRTAVVAVLAYVGLVLFLRISGKRTLSKLNAFDLVVTVALGSILATTLLNKSVALAEGLLALACLIGLQYLVTWSSVRFRWVREGVRSESTILVRNGQPLEDVLRRERITEDEATSAVRDAGGRTLAEAEVVILESDGSLTAILART